jgi:hypothetical protein
LNDAKQQLMNSEISQEDIEDVSVFEPMTEEES